MSDKKIKNMINQLKEIDFPRFKRIKFFWNAVLLNSDYEYSSDIETDLQYLNNELNIFNKTHKKTKNISSALKNRITDFLNENIENKTNLKKK